MSFCPQASGNSLFPFAGGAEGQTVGSQFPRDPSSSLQGAQLGEPAESAAFQGEGLTEPQNSVGAGALINQLPAAAPTAGSPAVLPAASQEDIKASLAVSCHALCLLHCHHIKRHVHAKQLKHLAAAQTSQLQRSRDNDTLAHRSSLNSKTQLQPWILPLTPQAPRKLLWSK